MCVPTNTHSELCAHCMYVCNVVMCVSDMCCYVCDLIVYTLYVMYVVMCVMSYCKSSNH
jgi:hypothetical protein